MQSVALFIYFNGDFKTRTSKYKEVQESAQSHTIGKWYGSKVKVKVKSLSRVRLFATPWTVAYQDPQSMGFSRQEYWSGNPKMGCHCLLQGIFPTQGSNLGVPHCRQTLYHLSYQGSFSPHERAQNVKNK